MIQRIQSVYLLLVAVLMAATFICPLMFFADSFSANSIGIFFENELRYPTWGVMTFAALAALLAFVNIFLFKKRKTQIKVCNTILILILAFYATLATYIYTLKTSMNLLYENIGYGLVFPAIAFIFLFLSLHKIKADEKLIRSLDRIR